MPTTRPTDKVADKLVELEMDNLTALEQGNVEKAILSHCKEISLIQVKTIKAKHVHTNFVGLLGESE